jgi:GTP-binding protein
VPFGGPDGGNGGEGGNVIIATNPSISDLSWFRRRRQFKAGDGSKGGKGKKQGKKGDDLVIEVPPGTLVCVKERHGDEALLADLVKTGQGVIVARGGRGGWGNAHFATATNQLPQIATEGEAGEERFLVLQLKLLADVGIIGYPNVGKSSLLASVSRARPEIAEYPFTTREPVLGVVDVGRSRIIVAEIPAIIEGAHLGRGLGYDFLRHVERSKVLIHLLDGTSLNLIDDLSKVNAELALFSPSLLEKPQILAVNKIDLLEGQARLSEIESILRGLNKPVFFISAATGEGVAELIAKAAQIVDSVGVEKDEREIPVAIFRPQPKGRKAERLR